MASSRFISSSVISSCETHAGAEAGHVDDAQVAVHEQVGHAGRGLDAEGGGLDQANLALIAAFEGVFAQVLEGVFIFEGEADGRGRVEFVELFVVFVGVDAVEEDVEIFVPLGFGGVGAFFDEGVDAGFGLFTLAVVGDVELVDLGELAEAADALGEFVFGPVGEDEGFGFVLGGLLDVDDGAGDGGDGAGGQQVTAEEGVDERAFADAGAAEEDEGVGTLGEDLLGLVDVELGIGHGADEVVARAIDRLLEIDPVVDLDGADVGQRGE